MGNCLDFCKGGNIEKYTELTSTIRDKDYLRSLYDFKTKIILLGDTNVGKTSILKVLSNKRYPLETTPTIGVDFDMINIEDEQHKNVTYKICVWDTAGNPQYKLATQMYYRDSRVFCLVFDVTDRKTFAELLNIIDEIDKHTDQNKKYFILIANKINLHKQRIIPSLESNSFARQYGFYYCEMDNNPQQTYQTIVGILKIICRNLYSVEIADLRNKLAVNAYSKKTKKTNLDFFLSQKYNANIVNYKKRENEKGCLQFFGVNSTNNTIVGRNAKISSIENGVSYEPL